VVAEGETLESIAERYYGDPTRADEIYQANRDVLEGPEHLAPGQRLLIP
jgi:nucleoid-associated protein YgaU